MSLHYSTYNESVFRASVQDALDRVQSILDTTRHPRLAADDENHKNYDDKYLLVEFVTNSSNAAFINVLQQHIGLDSEKLAQVVKWVKDDKKTVTLRFQASDGCSLIKEQQVKIDVSPHQFDTETTITTTTVDTHEGGGGSGSGGSLRNLLGTNKTTTKNEKTTTRVTRTVTEYHWKVEASYKISIFAGDAAAVAMNSDDMESNNVIELESRHVVTTIVTAGGGQSSSPSCGPPVYGGGSGGGRPHLPTPPIPDKTVHYPLDVNLTWLFSTLEPNFHAPKFSINRNDIETCKTPRRNVQVQTAVDMYCKLLQWASAVQQFIIHRLSMTIERPAMTGQTMTTTTTLPLWELHTTARSIFVPILPIMEHGNILSDDDANKLLQAQVQSMQQVIDNSILKMYPNKSDKSKIISTLEATLVVLSHHVKDICTTYHYSVDYIEEMLRNQLIQAIGKEIHAKDFDAFMNFYYKKLFSAHYTPKPFTYAIRQPNRYPDGILSIEDISSTMSTATTSGRERNGNNSNNKVEPVASLVRHVPAMPDSTSSIFIPINAATSIEITGDRYIHGWMQHVFSSSSLAATCGGGPMTDDTCKYQLAARARQFCSFMIIIGNMAGPNVFQPKEAIILQNKDEVLIPLITKVLPSAKEFKDAIASLSPEQQAFAKEFRSMQLETSVFGVCVVQIKPQLEKLLGLPHGALTKEIQLTQDLMSLFVDYQIPSDLLSFDAVDGATTTEMSMAAKLAAVKSHVKSVMDVLEVAKEKQLIEEERKADMRAEMKAAKEKQLIEEKRKADMRAEMKFQSGMIQVQGAAPIQIDWVGSAVSSARSSAKLRAVASAGVRAAAELSMDSAPVKDLERFSLASSAEAFGGSYQSDMASFETGGVDVSQQRMNQQAKDHNDVPGLDKARLKGEDITIEDYTMIPKLLDAKLEAFDTDNSLRPTIIEAGTTWTRKRQENLLTSAKMSSLDPSIIQEEKNRAFDLLDALSRSGTLPIDCAELHVMVGVTHCFENDVMGTVIQDNINPIYKVEKSLLMLASTIFQEPVHALLHYDDGQLHQRLTTSFPKLFLEPGQTE